MLLTLKINKMKTLQSLKQSILVINKVLKEKVETMKPMELLRNSHPIYRGDYAFKLYKEDIISKGEAAEFTKLY